jgi:hypothetical protein
MCSTRPLCTAIRRCHLLSFVISGFGLVLNMYLCRITPTIWKQPHTIPQLIQVYTL